MTYHEELMVHPPKMAEMAGGVVEAEGHGTPVTSPDGIGWSPRDSAATKTAASKARIRALLMPASAPGR